MPKIAIDKIVPDPDQPRKTFKQETILELKESFNTIGLLQPITVRLHKDKYMIIIGERRYRAAKIDGLAEVECVIREGVDDKTVREMQFAENAGQEDIPPLELGQAFFEHRTKYKMTADELAQRVGLSRPYVIQLEAIFTRLSDNSKRLIKSGELDARTAYSISTIKDAQRQDEFAKVVAEKGIPLREVGKIKPMVEEQKYRPVESIYQSYRQQQDEKYEEAQPQDIPEIVEMIDKSEMPVRVIELLTQWEETIILTNSFNIDLFKELSSSQQADFIAKGRELIDSISSFIEGANDGV